MDMEKKKEDNRNRARSILGGFLVKEKRDFFSLDLWRANVAEFFGTMMLVCIVAVGTSIHPQNGPHSSVHVALAAGFYIGTIIAILMRVSGGHVNPAMSVGFLVVGKITCCRCVLYVIFQSLGAIAGAATMTAMVPEAMHQGFGVIMPGNGVTELQALSCEVLVTFYLVFGSFALIDPGRDDVKGSVPLLIGLMVSVGIFGGWHISGGCMNPARALGPAVIARNLQHQWLYWVGPLIGAVWDPFFTRQYSPQA
ncbi:hypothetical protein ACJMK2_038700 [Sinanodonta woodiana]|uniref:Uncharacterized protein n=1 Tax=Sinanodonta woodiana TaxID=1069815 RepID=A0ABD3WCW7_SINWO